jgi:fatty acid desaturase
MLAWARINDKWRITHNEFEHYSFGKMDDSLGRGAKTIRTSFPDVFELVLGLAGTLIVYNATGTKELRRVPHVMLLPFVRRRLNRILERTAITAAAMEEEEEDDDA